MSWQHLQDCREQIKDWSFEKIDRASVSRGQMDPDMRQALVIRFHEMLPDHLEEYQARQRAWLNSRRDADPEYDAYLTAEGVSR